MKQQGYTNPNQLVQYFESKLMPMIKGFGKTFVGWQEIFDAYGLALPANTIIEVWEDEGKYSLIFVEPCNIIQNFYFDFR